MEMDIPAWVGALVAVVVSVLTVAGAAWGFHRRYREIATQNEKLAAEARARAYEEADRIRRRADLEFEAAVARELVRLGFGADDSDGETKPENGNDKAS